LKNFEPSEPRFWKRAWKEKGACFFKQGEQVSHEGVIAKRAKRESCLKTLLRGRSEEYWYYQKCKSGIVERF